jgi:hypothetical protein
LCIAGVAAATFLALGAFAPRASADLPSVPGSAVVDEATQAAAPVTDQVAPVEQAAAPAVQPVTQAAAPAVDQATEAAAPAVDQAAQAVAPPVTQVTQATAPAVDQVVQATAPVVRPTAEAAAPVVSDVARATSQLSRSATGQASRLSDNPGGGGSANGESAALHGISTAATTHATETPAQPGGVAPQRRHNFSLAHPASPQLALTHADGVRQTFAAHRPSPSTGSGSEPGRHPGGRPSPAPAPLQAPATQEGAVATSGSSGGLGASGAIIFTFILAASLGLRRLSLASDPLGPAPLVLLPERPG